MIRILPLAALLLAASPAPAFWEYGHETVAGIAYAQASPKARAEIRRLLRHAPEMATPGCPLGTIEQASVWADCIKPLGPRFSYAYSWHYQNVNVCQPFALKEACKDGNCVSAQIDRNEKLLADRTLPMRERLMALAFLVHFVGDLHQPMHAGDRGDLGGNRLKAQYGQPGVSTNIHAIWDGYLAERAISTPLAGPAGLIAEHSAAERAAMAQGTTEDWSRENWAVARDAAYASVLGGDPCGPVPEGQVTLDEGRIEALIPVFRLQIVRGGMRLARLLDAALG